MGDSAKAIRSAQYPMQRCFMSFGLAQTIEEFRCVVELVRHLDRFLSPSRRWPVFLKGSFAQRARKPSMYLQWAEYAGVKK
jgi:hypothetical protein